MNGDYDLDYQRAEATRRWQYLRTLNIAVGDMHLEVARAQVTIRREYRAACGSLVKASEAYGHAGLSHRSRVVWRYCRLLHAAQWRAAR